MLSLLLLSHIFSFTYDTALPQVNHHQIYRFTPNQSIIDADNENGYLTIAFIPSNNLPHPLMDMYIADDDGRTIKSLHYPQNWVSNATDTSAFNTGVLYVTNIPYTASQSYFNTPINFYYDITRATSTVHAFSVFISYTFDGAIGEGGEEDYNRGYDAGYDAGNANGYYEGYDVGYDEGKAVGYNEGASDNYSNNWFKSVFRSLSDILNIELFPNLTIGYIIAIPLILSLIAFIVGWFK